jgi:hypothetical protein
MDQRAFAGAFAVERFFVFAGLAPFRAAAGEASLAPTPFVDRAPLAEAPFLEPFARSRLLFAVCCLFCRTAATRSFGSAFFR